MLAKNFRIQYSAATCTTKISEPARIIIILQFETSTSLIVHPYIFLLNKYSFVFNSRGAISHRLALSLKNLSTSLLCSVGVVW